MKAKINFYQESLWIKHDPMPLNTVAYLWFATFTFMAIVWSFYTYSAHTKHITLQQSEVQLKQAKVDLETATRALAKKQNKTKLVNELKSLQLELQHKLQIFGHLKRTSAESITDYSDVMNDLALYHEPNIWLTDIKFVGQKVILRGQTLQSKYLPIWFNNLKQSAFFANKEFSVLELTTKDQVSEFNVATDLYSEGEKP